MWGSNAKLIHILGQEIINSLENYKKSNKLIFDSLFLPKGVKLVTKNDTFNSMLWPFQLRVV